MPAISFFTESVSYNLPQKLKLKKWIKATIEKEGFELQELNFIFCSDEYLLSINQNTILTLILSLSIILMKNSKL